jgi:NAD(P)-dependent dehydrogenase (short-subunit alcohol dehydrogenase family)
MAGKICMITGSNSGIGKETAVGLARMGASIVMVCRDRQRGEAAAKEISMRAGVDGRREGGGGGVTDLFIADLSILGSVRQLAQDFKKKYRRLDVLVNNAGLILAKRTLTKEGLETTFVVNYLSHFLLTNLLLDLLKSSAPSRIINVSSVAHLSGHIDFDDLQGETKYGALRAYSQSKLAQMMFTYELAKRLEGTGVTVNAVHPGNVATNWGRKSAGALSVLLRLASPFLLSPEKGADTLIYLASSPEVANVTGKYFFKRKQVESSAESTDEEKSKRLWEISERLCGLK